MEKTAGIGGAQVWALATIRDRPGIGINELAAAMDVHQSTASNLVRALLAKNLVATSRDGSDKRMVQLKLRAAGAAVLRRAPAPFTGVLPQALLKIDPRTLVRLERDLASLIAGLGADSEAAQKPLGQLWSGKRGPRRPLR